MPKVLTARSKRPPDGWDDIEPVLDDIQRRMREAEQEPHEGKRKTESLWGVLRLDHQRSRYIFEEHFKKQTISKDLYAWLIKQGWANPALIAKWKKPGYDNLCCLSCVQPSNHAHGGVCICRVPRKDLGNNKTTIECSQCGCHGCS